MIFRGRRLRSNAALREMVQDVFLHPSDFIMPYFVVETANKGVCQPISSMPGQNQLGLDMLLEKVGKAVDNGLRACLLFGIPEKKDPIGSGAYAANGIVQQAISLLKKHFPNLQIVTDVCLCEYTSHGHCGLLSPSGIIQNDATLPLLAQVALSHANAGADIVAPSDMMDGRVLAIRQNLDEHGFHNLPIMSYSVKFASSFYGPFREAAESAPKEGNRKSYQMNFANVNEAMLEAEADIHEGADILMVKPAGAYLDIIRMVRDNFDLPLAAYQVSGEYSMIKAAGMNGWIDEDAAMLESLIAIKRAGAKLILSYFTEDLLAKRLI